MHIDGAALQGPPLGTGMTAQECSKEGKALNSLQVELVYSPGRTAASSSSAFGSLYWSFRGKVSTACMCSNICYHASEGYQCTI